MGFLGNPSRRQGVVFSILALVVGPAVLFTAALVALGVGVVAPIAPFACVAVGLLGELLDGHAVFLGCWLVWLLYADQVNPF